MITLDLVSSDIYSRDQSWQYAAVWRGGRGSVLVRVHVRANAYEHQSRAMISSWSADGWKFHTEIPTAEWYSDMPSYTRRDLDPDHEQLFYDLGERLIERYVFAMYGHKDIDYGTKEES